MTGLDAIRRLEKDIHDHRLDPSVDTRVKLWARARRSEIRSELELVTRPGGYEDFILSYLQREAAKYKAYLDGEPAAHPYGGERTRQLCSCTSSECPLKEERLPRQLDDAESLDRGIVRFRHAHRGHPLLLDEAREAFAETVTRVEQALTTITIGLANEVVIAPDGREFRPDELPPAWQPSDGFPDRDGGGDDASEVAA